MLDPLYNAIGWLLAVFYSFVPNLGVAIILLTCTVMLIVFPITARQTRSMIAMQRVQPEIKRIQNQYKGDKQKQNEEVLKFYQENKINPLSGCFPLLLQAPVFISLFHVLKNPQGSIPSSGRFDQLYNAICGPIAGTCAKIPQYFLGMNLEESAWTSSKVTGSFIETLPYFILVGLVVLTGWYQARQTMTRQQKHSPNAPANTQAMMIARIMPIFFGVISVSFASGLVLYFLTSNLWRIGQQQLVLNKMYEKAHAEPFTPKSTPPVEAASKETEAKPIPRPGSPRKRSGSGSGNKPPAAKAPKSGASTGGNGKNAPTSGTSNGTGAPTPAARRKKKKKR